MKNIFLKKSIYRFLFCDLIRSRYRVPNEERMKKYENQVISKMSTDFFKVIDSCAGKEN